MIGNSNDEINFPQTLLLTNTQVANLHNTSTNNSSVNVKLWKTLLSKIVQSEGFLYRLLGPLLKTGFALIKSVTKPLAKSVLIPLGLKQQQQQGRNTQKNLRLWNNNTNNIWWWNGKHYENS